ncbi:MAG TPA: FKBP-type peptidyl-prolyl cis-trans isomerase [Bacteroidales bacterium]|nr:FKBP-type peptidyl-prolyl cis-trans isomerase [Bacteroidales bacterium]
MTIKTHIQTVVVLLALVLAAGACSKSKYPGFKKAENGVYIKWHTKGAGEVKPQLNDLITLSMVYRLEDSILFDTRTLPEPLTFPVIEPTFEGDIYAAFTLMRVGDSVTVVFPADSFFMVMARMPEMPDFAKPGQPIYFDMKLIELKTAEQAKAEERAKLLEMKEMEQVKLQEYLAANNVTVQPLESGLYYIETKKGAGKAPEPGDVMQLHFTIKTIDGSTLYSTEGNSPMDVEFGAPFDTKGFDEALTYLRKGTKANLIVPSPLAFDSTGRQGIVPPYTTLLYNVELVDFKTKAQVEKERALENQRAEAAAQKARKEESEKIAAYLRTNNITVAPKASGLYYIETEKGTGKQVENGKKIKVHYTLYNLSGKMIQSSKDSGQPFEFTVGQGQVIKGWDEALTYMREGGKAKLILPSDIAYGGTDRGPDIPAYSTLVFEVEVLEVMDSK